jgi:WD40 repeat protein
MNLNVVNIIFNNLPIFTNYKILEKLKCSTLLETILKVNKKETSIENLNSTSTLENQNDPINCMIKLSNRTIASTHNRHIKIWSLTSLKIKHFLSGHHNKVLSLLQLTNKKLVSASKDTSIRIWDPEFDYKTVKILTDHDNEVDRLLLLKQSGNFISASKDFVIIIWDSETLKPIRLVKEANSVLDILELSNHRFATACWDGNLNLYSLTGNMIQRLKSGLVYICKVIELKNKSIAAGIGDGTIAIWDCDYNLCQKIAAHKSAVYCLIQIGSNLITGSGDCSIKVWNRSFECIKTLSNHSFYVITLFRLKDNRLVSFSIDSTIKIWSADMKLINNVNEQVQGFSNLIELKDGRLIISGTNTIKIYSSNI